MVFAVFGLGMFGRELCHRLAEKGSKVIAIDKNADLIDRIKDTVAQAVLLDSTDEESFRSAPLENVDIAIVAIGDNIESSILTTALLKQLGIPFILARAVSEIHARVLTKIGADRIINIEVEEGQRIAQELIAPAILEKVPISRTISIAEIQIPKSFVKKTLVELDLRRTFHVTLVSVKRIFYSVDNLGNPVQDEVVLFPDPNEALKENDVLLIVGENADIERLNEY